MKITTKNQRYEYIEQIAKNFPNTLFQFTFIKDNELNWSRKRTFVESDEFSFIKKDNYFRSNLWNETTDEIRLDFDYENIEENIYRMRGVIERLLILNIEKFETYLTGGKGTHLLFRFDFVPFKQLDRQKVREAIFKTLNCNVEIDKTLFQTIQVIGLEGFNHRKTNEPKQRIKIDYNSYEILDENLNFNYLTEKYVNKFNIELIETIKNNISNCDHQKKELKLNISQNNNYNKNKFEWHILRFREIYLSLKDGRKRLLDMLVRYLYLTTKNKDETKEYFEKFCLSLKICINIEDKIKNSIKCMKKNAIFIYTDILTKEEFYKTWKY